MIENPGSSRVLLDAPRTVHLAHSARAERSEDLVGAEAGAGLRAMRIAEVYASRRL